MSNKKAGFARREHYRALSRSRDDGELHNDLRLLKLAMAGNKSPDDRHAIRDAVKIIRDELSAREEARSCDANLGAAPLG